MVVAGSARAIVGGVAVAAWLGQAHRVTRDVDTVVDQDHLPAAIAVLRGRVHVPGSSQGESRRWGRERSG
jgi:hypothetical protein